MPQPQPSILMVDDEPELLEIFALWLGRTGYRVLTAANGAEALAILKTTHIDVLITDTRMPVMDGLTLVRSIHDLKLLIPSVIFVSGFADVDHRELYALGAEALLPKPLARADLIQALETSLKPREELWLEPSSEPVTQTLELTFSSLDEAGRAKEFSIGRGGVCTVFPEPADPGALIGLVIQFEQDKLVIAGQATVRWYDATKQHAGLEFVYLEPASRRRVIDAMRGKARFSYIPSC